jgi:hypothetical protein
MSNNADVRNYRLMNKNSAEIVEGDRVHFDLRR